jgi:hypothetical protein
MIDVNNNGIDDREEKLGKGEDDLLVNVTINNKVGFFESKPGEFSSTRLSFIIGSILAYVMSAISFGIGLYLILTGQATLIGALASLVGICVGPIFTFISTTKLVQNSQEKE